MSKRLFLVLITFATTAHSFVCANQTKNQDTTIINITSKIRIDKNFEK